MELVTVTRLAFFIVYHYPLPLAVILVPSLYKIALEIAGLDHLHFQCKLSVVICLTKGTSHLCGVPFFLFVAIIPNCKTLTCSIVYHESKCYIGTVLSLFLH